MQYMIRQGSKGDTPFIINSWVLALRSSGLYRGCPNSLLNPRLSKIIEGLITAPGTTILVSHDVNDVDSIHGYLVHEGNTILFSYVKFASRRKGVFRALLEKAKLENISYVFQTYPAFKLGEKLKWVYRPYGIVYVPF